VQILKQATMIVKRTRLKMGWREKKRKIKTINNKIWKQR
jgi:hypothetical protein